MNYQVQIPRVESATVSPNPVDINTGFLISLSVSEETVILEPYYYYSGDLYAGEV